MWGGGHTDQDPQNSLGLVPDLDLALDLSLFLPEMIHYPCPVEPFSQTVDCPKQEQISLGEIDKMRYFLKDLGRIGSLGQT